MLIRYKVSKVLVSTIEMTLDLKSILNRLDQTIRNIEAKYANFLEKMKVREECGRLISHSKSLQASWVSKTNLAPLVALAQANLCSI